MRFELYEPSGLSHEQQMNRYDEIKKFAADPSGKATEIDRDTYMSALNMMPPMMIGLGNWMICEALTENRYGAVHACFKEVRNDLVGSRYYAKWATRGKKDTYIQPDIGDTYPIL